MTLKLIIPTILTFTVITFESHARIYVKTADIAVANLPEKTKNDLNSFVNETISLLPAKFPQNISKDIEIIFRSMGKLTLTAPTCDQLSKRQFPKYAAGIVASTVKSASTTKLILNIDFFRSLINSENKSTNLSCGLKNYYRLAQAEILGQVIQIQEEENVTKISSTLEWSRLVRRLDPKINDENPEQLKKALGNYFSYYLLDEDFKCRLPSMYEFLETRLGSPKTTSNCDKNETVWFTNTGKQSSLNHSRLYQIHLLLANPGPRMESRWGHIMYRLVFCSPKRKTVSAECLKDLNDHIVLSYVGNPESIFTSMKDGLTGKYPTRLTINEFSRVLNEYTIKEGRDLSSIPLKITSLEAKTFLNRALEEYWSYEGNYYFLSNNCVTESLHFLQSVVTQRSLILKADPLIQTPVGLKDFLAKRNLLDESVLTSIKEGKASDYYFTSPKNIWKETANVDSNEDFNKIDFSIRKTLQERRRDFDLVVSDSPEKVKSIAMRFYRRELAIYESDSVQIQTELGKILQQDPKEAGKEYAQSLFSIQLGRRLLWPVNRAIPGYGIPLVSELKSKEEVRRAEEYIRIKQDNVKAMLKRDKPWLFSNLHEINDNMIYFYSFIKKANQGHYTKENL